ncbi:MULTISPECIES: hypothetical protein [Leptolyngbya]|nr:hypothetical protein [Leptolyngbya sp. FACHB-1624]MBD1854735.1 hypothetical protein [Leptolyngbya sp. FACHB-1624]
MTLEKPETIDITVKSGGKMIEVYYLDHIVKAVSHDGGWQVYVNDPTPKPMRVYTSSAVYATAEEAMGSGKEFVRRQAALSLILRFLDEWRVSEKISDAELDALSASLCFFCCFQDSYSPKNYWYQ